MEMISFGFGLFIGAGIVVLAIAMLKVADS